MDRLMVSVSGVRGTIGGTLTPQVAQDFGSAFAAMLGAGKKVVIGRDTRTSGPMIRSAVVEGLLAGGVDVIDLGVVTTPGVALMTSRLEAAGGVVITASHNPVAYNGIKFLDPNGTGLTVAGAAELKEIWQSGRFSPQPTDARGTEIHYRKTHGIHVDAVCAVIDRTKIASRRIKVVLDSINGAGCVVTPMLLSTLGCEYKQINADATGLFAHPPEPIAENLADLGDAVRRYKTDIGFAQDPDGDRLVIVDENGVFIGEEYTLALTAAFVLSRRKGKVAANLATSRMIDDIAAAAGAEVVRAPTGEANVAEAMATQGCIFGGEGNGGVIEPRVVPVRDSLVAIAYMLQYLAETEQTVSELVALIPRYVMIKTKFPCPDGVAPEVARRTREAFDGRSGARFNDLDGLRIDLPEAWVSVRASNTEPIMRIMAEAPERSAAESLIAEVRTVADAVIAKSS